MKKAKQIDGMLQRVLMYGERISKERPVSEFEKEGRLLTLYGVVCMAAFMLYETDQAARNTLLYHLQLDFDRLIDRFIAQKTLLKRTLSREPLFRDRDTVRYPKVTMDEILSVREQFKAMEKLPSCGNGSARKTNIDVAAMAYKMFDILFLGHDTIVDSLKSLAEIQQMLDDPEYRSKVYLQMYKTYQEKDWMAVKEGFLKELDLFKSQFTNEQEALEAFLSQLDQDALNHVHHGIVATINHHYKNQHSHFEFIYHNRHLLTQEDVNNHLYYVSRRELVLEQMEQYQLKQPPTGQYAKLFKTLAAQKLAELLTPVIAMHVDFKNGYHYAAWALAMKDAGLIYANERNGLQITKFINATFGEQIENSTLYRYISNRQEFDKIKDRYEVIMAIIGQALGRTPKTGKDYFRHESEEFHRQLKILQNSLALTL